MTLYVDQDIYSTMAAKLTETMVRPYQAPRPEDIRDRYTAVLAGPGWGQSGRCGLLRTLLQSGVPGVLDADGIAVLREHWDSVGSEEVRSTAAGRWVLTPHPGEFLSLVQGTRFEVDKARLLADPVGSVVPVAKDLQVVVLLKSHVLWVVSPDGSYQVIDGMNPAMGTGGSGDVLAGLVLGILAGGYSPFEAAGQAAYLHQAAGQFAAEEYGMFLAGDLMRAISFVRGKGGACHGSQGR